jgi:hypothetical protein
MLRVKNIRIKIKNTERIYLKLTTFSLKFFAEVIRVWAILRAKNI